MKEHLISFGVMTLAIVVGIAVYDKAVKPMTTKTA